ncbi:sulfatase-like hydrolase/transferase [Halorientalis marina]|uniref:sulfatase-like hydrolase/transferase n=1 Tax=Halorientalis marina TaxID=2931976 RepID=UPI001FF1ACBE|nr:sulfatase-like hydrolase/transferase [Halorientalis marina]
MDSPLPLQTQTDADTVTNVVIFIADSLRRDATPDRVTERGISAEAIAPSTYTASSVPSLLTGLYPSEHRIWDFSGRLSQPPLLFRSRDNVGFNAETIWTHVEAAQKPPLKMLGLSPGEDLADLSEPFVYVEHDKGGHAPYGYSFEECDSVHEFYDNRVEDPDEIGGLYRESVDRSLERFLEVLETLERRELLEDTLVIYTSDHGELLGEREYGYMYGHGSPVTPALVRTPLVFMGAGLPSAVQCEQVVSGTGVAPTALGALGIDVPQYVSGTDVWNTRVSSQVHRSELWTKANLNGRHVATYKATSAWNGTGGIVRHRGPRWRRAAMGFISHNFGAPHAELVRDRLSPRAQWNLLRSYTPHEVRYGDGSCPDPGLGAIVDDFQRDGPEMGTVTAETTEHLEKMGYL